MSEIELTQGIQNNINTVLTNISDACSHVGRSKSEVTLVLVTKKQPIQKVEAAYRLGQIDFGENYPEEALDKIAHFAEKKIHWHMIGHLQSRKAGLVAEHFDFWHSLDRMKTAKRVDEALARQNKQIHAFLEVNFAQEESKSGWLIDAEHKNSFYSEVEKLLALKNITLCGVMTMPPFAENPEDSRPFFKQAKELQLQVKEKFALESFNYLSIGTTQDYMVAVEEGATHVRIGSAILGSRG